MADPVGYDGFDEARRALKKMQDPEKSREYKQANFDIANEVVIPAARANASTRLQRRAAGTLVAVRTESGGSVRLGQGFPAALGAEFGADRNQPRRVFRYGKSFTASGFNQFNPWRGSDGDAGYFLWPAIREQEGEIINRYDRLFRDLFDEGGG